MLLAIILIANSFPSQNIDSVKQVLNSSGEDTIKLSRLSWLSQNIASDKEWPKYNLMLYELALKLEKSNNPSIKYNAKKYLGNAINDMGFLENNKGNYDKALEFYERSLKIRQEIGDNSGIASSNNNIGLIFFYKGHIIKALDYFGSAVRAQEVLGDKAGVATSLFNIGFVYNRYGDILKSIEFYTKSLKIREEIGDNSGIAASLNALGLLYVEQREYQKSIECYSKSLKIREEIGDKSAIANSLLNFGHVYSKLGEDKKALDYFQRSLKMNEEIGDKDGIAAVSINLGGYYQTHFEFDKALIYLQRSMKINQESGDKASISETCINLSSLYFSVKNFKTSRIYAAESLELSTELGFPEKIRNAERWLYLSDSAMGNYKEAFDHYKRFKFFSDSLNNEVTRKAAIKSQFQIEFNRKEREVNVKAEMEKKLIEQKNSDERKQKNIIIYSVLFGLLVVIVFSGFLFKSLSKNKKANVIITQQKAEVEQSKKEIVDSINYAKRIQYALLASDNLLKNNLSEHFVLFQPKDVVSGDFYWGTQTEDGFIYITADCTGHGVPGAFMSLLNISKLSQAISENKITRPDLILNNVRTEITKALNPEGTVDESKDGMDAVLCKLNLKKMKLEYAAAYNSFYLIRNNEVIIYKADKMPVGKGHDDSVLFTYNEVALQKGDTIYTFTDGFADQFGGPKGKKFKYKQLEEVLLSIHQQPMNKQKEILAEKFNTWKGKLDQIDDMLVIGVRIT